MDDVRQEEFYDNLVKFLKKNKQFLHESQTGTPPEVMADYIVKSIEAFNAATLFRDSELGYKPWEK